MGGWVDGGAVHTRLPEPGVGWDRIVAVGQGKLKISHSIEFKEVDEVPRQQDLDAVVGEGGSSARVLGDQGGHGCPLAVVGGGEGEEGVLRKLARPRASLGGRTRGRSRGVSNGLQVPLHFLSLFLPPLPPPPLFVPAHTLSCDPLPPFLPPPPYIHTLTHASARTHTHTLYELLLLLCSMMTDVFFLTLFVLIHFVMCLEQTY